MADRLLEVDALTAGYGEVQVLWGISLGVPRGKLITMVGANGAGKSTTLKALVGSIAPWGGRILFDGDDVTRLPAHAKAARGLVLVPEGRQLFADMTAEENLEMGAYPRRARLRSPTGAGIRALSAPQGAATTACRHFVRRRAADAGDRAGPDDGSGDPYH